MGKQKYVKTVMELFEKSPVVSFSSLKKHLKSAKYAKLFVHNLTKRGAIKKLTKGCYTIHNNPQLAIFCFKPAYFGLQDALSSHNLWEQETIPIIITTRKVRNGIRTILGTNVLVRTLNKKLFFGYDYQQVGEFCFPYSDIEKTFIDMAYFREPLNKEVIKEIRKKINKKKIKKYLTKYDARTEKIVLKILKQSFSRA